MRRPGVLTLVVGEHTTCFWMVLALTSKLDSGLGHLLEAFLQTTMVGFCFTLDMSLTKSWLQLGDHRTGPNISLKRRCYPTLWLLLSGVLQSRDAAFFAFIDNKAAKSSWITGTATSDVAQRVLHNGTRLEADLDVWPFFSRVPTHSSMGDDPSRGRFEMLEMLGARRTEITDAQVLQLVADMDTSRTHE